MADPARAARLARRIQVIVAEALRSRVKDDRAELITVTDARVTNDLQHATVYYTVMGDESARSEADALLERSRGVLRHEVGRQLTIRLTPTLDFVADEIPENAAHLEDLLRRAREQDAEVAALREGASPAGEGDPYRSHGEADVEAETAPDAGTGSEADAVSDGDR
ncbi:30S ribosome-binding factor RbfA [Nesterenkonia marinintestina]|uniref:30S ribosome-binding factor RbfA n=1 Tax=Nesterenkonia marinintestina TaxID=2979865 RepID=UPI0021C042AB|nr:30S ribosome-binding factor RbfA [Nesterenkonia sp. GX14115]